MSYVVRYGKLTLYSLLCVHRRIFVCTEQRQQQHKKQKTAYTLNIRGEGRETDDNNTAEMVMALSFISLVGSYDTRNALHPAVVVYAASILLTINLGK